MKKIVEKKESIFDAYFRKRREMDKEKKKNRRNNIIVNKNNGHIHTR